MRPQRPYLIALFALLLLLAAPALAETVKVRLAISGMTCGHCCCERVNDKLKTISGVSDVYVDINLQQATLKLDTGKNSPAAVAQALDTLTRGRYKATVIKERS